MILDTGEADLGLRRPSSSVIPSGIAPASIHYIALVDLFVGWKKKKKTEAIIKYKQLLLFPPHRPLSRTPDLLLLDCSSYNAATAKDLAANSVPASPTAKRQWAVVKMLTSGYNSSLYLRIPMCTYVKGVFWAYIKTHI